MISFSMGCYRKIDSGSQRILRPLTLASLHLGCVNEQSILGMIGCDRWRAPACPNDAYRLADSREFEMKGVRIAIPKLKEIRRARIWHSALVLLKRFYKGECPWGRPDPKLFSVPTRT